MNSNAIEILIVDDHDLVRSTLADRIDQEIGFSVCGCLDNTQAMMELLPHQQPQILLLDIDLDGEQSFDEAMQISVSIPSIRIVFLSAYIYDRYIEQALECNAYGYFSKHEDLDLLMDGLRKIAEGRRCFSPQVRNRLAIGERGFVLTKDNVKTRCSTLTDRERSILQSIAAGLSKRDIAVRHHLSVKTVETHSDNLMTKLGIHDRVQLTRFAIQEGLVEV